MTTTTNLNNWDSWQIIRETINNNFAIVIDRANHTWTQDVNTITWLLETVEDIVGGQLTPWANITIQYNDATWKIEIGASWSLTTVSWSWITGDLNNQVDLKNALDNKQETLISWANIATINWQTLLQSWNIAVWNSIIQQFIAWWYIGTGMPTYLNDNWKVYEADVWNKFNWISNWFALQWNTINITTAWAYTWSIYDPLWYSSDIGPKYLPPSSWNSKSVTWFTARGECSSVVNAGLIYVMGWYNWSARLATLEVYNTTTNTWSSLANMPIAIRQWTAQVHNGIIYYFGGETSSWEVQTVYAYNISTNTWSTLANMPTKRRLLKSVIYNWLIYVMGWYYAMGGGSQNKLEIYNPTTNTWTTGANMPTAKYWFVACVLSWIIYTVCWNNWTTKILNKDTYNISTNTWTWNSTWSCKAVEKAVWVFSWTTLTIYWWVDDNWVSDEVWSQSLASWANFIKTVMPSKRQNFIWETIWWDYLIWWFTWTTETTPTNLNYYYSYDLNFLRDTWTYKIWISTSSTNLILWPNFL